MPPTYILVTGATGFIGAHVVDVLLNRGIRVRGAARSMAKAKAVMDARPAFVANQQLEFVQIQDFESPGDLKAAAQSVDAIIHVASPFTYDTTDNEKELIIPAINGVRSILEAAAAAPSVQRVVITSSFAAVVDKSRQAPPYFVYTASDWSPLTYEEAIAPGTDAVVAYRASKKFAEREAWQFMEKQNPQFDLVTLCPPMAFGPCAHPVADNKPESVNESNRGLWGVACGVSPLPEARVPFWVDVRDLALAHVEAALRPEVGGQRFIPASPEAYSFGLAARIVEKEFPDMAGKVCQDVQEPDLSHGIDGQTAGKKLGYEYRKFEDTVRDLVTQLRGLGN